MPEIKPFPAVYYNPSKIADLAKVVCPPYDVISPQQQDGYYEASEHNFIRVLLGKDKPGDGAQENRYTRAKNTFEQWLNEGIMLQDERPCIYFYRQEYKVSGAKHSRLGFISLMRVQDDENAKIFPHENTHSKAKEDRLKVWSTLSANLGAIFVCFSDQGKTVEKIFLKNFASKKPFMEVMDDDNVKHIVWRLDDPALIAEVSGSLSQQQLFIADGHHRYEVAKELRRIKLSQTEKPTGDEPFNFVMTYFTNMDSKDLQIFPMHRIVRRLPREMDFLEEFFRVDKIKFKEDLPVLLAKAGKNEHAFGLYTKEGMRLLRLKNKLLIDKLVTEGSSDYRHLDATILKYFIFDRVGLASEDIVYTKDTSETIRMVDEQEAAASFIMNPVRIQQLKNIALNGERMPPKTTYFYPKVLSGLTIYKMS